MMNRCQNFAFKFSLHRYIQGGRFDHADRLFSSVAKSWQSVMESTADVKELIPEFYCLPEFLDNSNGFDLGVRQGLTLVHFSAQLEPCLSQENTLHTLNNP